MAPNLPLQNLVRIRTERGISQDAMAEFLGIARQTYNYLETGRNDTLNKYVNKICEFIGISTSDLYQTPELKEAENLREQIDSMKEAYETALAEVKASVSAKQAIIDSLRGTIESQNKCINLLENRIRELEDKSV